MPAPPYSTRAPRPEDLFMPGISYQVEAPTSTATPTPQHSQLPIRLAPETNPPSESPASSSSSSSADTKFNLPKVRLEIRDLTHPGASIFLSTPSAATILQTCVQDVLRQLYVSPSAAARFQPPPTRSVTLILRDLGGGVAHTVGTDLDADHKEIHFHLGYIASLPKARQADEIAGVVTHELVHCYQWTGRGHAPGGLVEGVADWVRLRCGRAPPHWKQDEDSGREEGGKGKDEGRWDAGYQHTAYFLAYLEGRFGADTVRRLNEALRTARYEEKAFWTGLLGRPVEQLWKDYREERRKQGVVVGGGRKDADGKVDEATQT